MAVESDETGDGWKRGVAAGLINRLQVLNPFPESIFDCPKAL